jgi:hypothetical protein
MDGKSVVAIVAALLVLALTPNDLSAQRGGGGGRGGGGMARGGGGGAMTVPSGPRTATPGFAYGGGGPGHPPGQFHSGPVGGVPVGPIPGSVFRGNPYVYHAPVGRTVIVSPPFGYYSPYYSPFYSSYPSYYSPVSPYIWNSSLYPTPIYSDPAYAASPVVQSSIADQNDVELSYQVRQLTREIEQLRADQAARAPAPPPQAPATPTVLVFRDGRRVEVQNYAIVGQTLWILEERVSTRIPTEELDLEATQAENRARGLRFPLP